jgi:hypothetical protein
VAARIEIQNEKKSFLDKVQLSQVDRYVDDTISHVKETIKGNKIREFTIMNLKHSLRINIEEELHREEQKQAVRELVKSRDVFGVGFEEF